MTTTSISTQEPSGCAATPIVFAEYLNAREIPGVRFVPTWFTPAKDAKLGGQRVAGVQMIVTDRSVLDAPELGLELG